MKVFSDWNGKRIDGSKYLIYIFIKTLFNNTHYQVW